MSGFITDARPSGRQIPAEGNAKTCKIAFIGEAPGRDEIRAGKPFVGAAGRVLNDCLHAAGIIRAQCYLTNLVKVFVPKGKIETYVKPSGAITSAGLEWQYRLHEELSNVDANILVPLGGPATWAVTGKGPVTKRRGYLCESVDELGNRKCLPTLHPASTLYGSNYVNKYYITHDLKKALKYSDSPDLVYDAETEYSVPRTVEEVRDACAKLGESGTISIDIEVENFEVQCIGIGADPYFCYVFPFAEHGLWTVEEEVEVWTELQNLLGRDDTAKVLQNGIFDIFFLIQRQHVYIRGPLLDTMLGHSLVYPDFLKGLGFLESIYCNRRYHKDLLKGQRGSNKREARDK